MYAIYILILKTLKDPAGILTHEKKKIKITEADRRESRQDLSPSLARPWGGGTSLFPGIFTNHMTNS